MTRTTKYPVPRMHSHQWPGQHRYGRSINVAIRLVKRRRQPSPEVKARQIAYPRSQGWAVDSMPELWR